LSSGAVPLKLFCCRIEWARCCFSTRLENRVGAEVVFCLDFPLFSKRGQLVEHFEADAHELLPEVADWSVRNAALQGLGLDPSPMARANTVAAQVDRVLAQT
jgi:hypothetical protein